MARGLSALLLTAAILAPPARAQAPQAVQMNALDMLNLYESNRALAVASFGDHLGLESIWDEVKGKGEKWINANGKAEADRRRLVLATFILLQAEQRFPDEPRWLLIRAWCANHHPMPPPLGPHPCWDHLVTSDHIWETCDARFWANTDKEYEKAMAVPAIAAEARVEFSLLHLKREHYDVVLTLLNEADRLTQDRELRYLSALIQGFAYEATHDPRRAAAMFQLALNAMPRAQTAGVNLGANLILDQAGPGGSARDSAAAFLTGALTAGVPDPWLTHREGEYRHWPQYIAELRKALK
jgi:hypothetical protein